MSRAGVARRVDRVEAALDLCIAAARTKGLRIVRHAFEDGDDVCALGAYNRAASVLDSPSLDLSKRNLDGEWDAIEHGWDGTPWKDAQASFYSTEGSFLSRAFYNLGVRLAAKHHPEDP